jgi:hypothetical protein
MLRRCTVVAARTNPNNLAGWSTPQMSVTQDGFAPPRHVTHDPRNVRREHETACEHIDRIVRENTFEPKEGDDRSFGGDGMSARTKAMSALRYMDRRMSMFAHEDMARNVLRLAAFYDSPNGTQFTNEFLVGKLVGLFLFSETERCLNFFHTLEEFANDHKDDLVIVGLSYCADEAINRTKKHGFCHLRHKNGAQYVKRDTGYYPNSLNPMPKLFICEGESGEIIDRQGVTSVVSRPNTCFNNWVNGRVGSAWYDMPKAWTL